MITGVRPGVTQRRSAARSLLASTTQPSLSRGGRL